MSVTMPTLIFLPAGVPVASAADDELLLLLLSPATGDDDAAASTSASTATARAKCDFTITELLFGC